MLATVILLATVAPVATFAKDPPGLARFMNAIAKVESGGRYTAQNASSGAYGKYQIMPSNWPAWARQYLGNAHAAPTPANQERVAAGEVPVAVQLAGIVAPRRVLVAHRIGRDLGLVRLGAAVRRQGHDRLQERELDDADRGEGQAEAVKLVPPRRRDQRAASRTTAAGTARATAGTPAARSATRRTAGATATITFTGKRIVWYGPVGPTRGKARILVDGVAVRTVDLHRSGFTGHAALFSRSWSAKGTHTLTIQVLGTKRHPMVAIDEFLVRR